MLFKPADKSLARQILLCVKIVTALCLAACAGVFASADVLVINSYHKGLEWTDCITAAIEDTFAASDTPVEIHTEYLDSRRTNILQDEPAMLELLKIKYAHTDIKSIILCDNDALDFFRRNRRFFSAAPAVFCGINYYNEKMIAGCEPVTGVVEESSPGQTIRLMKGIQPALKRCIIIGDRTENGNYEVDTAQSEAAKSNLDIKFEYWRDMPMPEMLAALAALDPKADAVLMTVFTRDSTGQSFNYLQSVEAITSSSKAAVYSLWYTYIGKGVVGGHVTNCALQGQTAAQLALKIIKGQKAEDIEIVLHSPNKYMFDYKMMQKFGIKMSDIPAGSDVIDGENIIPKPQFAKKIHIGVLANLGMDKCVEMWGPTADYLSLHIPDYDFDIIPLAFEDIEPAIKEKRIEFLITNPSQYVDIASQYDLSAVATLENLRIGNYYTQYGGVIICRSDRDDINTLDDLRQKSFMAVDYQSFGGWQMAWRELKERGIDPERDFSLLTFGGDHYSVVMAVLAAKVDAGTVRSDTLERMVNENLIDINDFKVINSLTGTEDYPFVRSTRLYPEWPFAATSRAPKELVIEVSNALIRMPQNSIAANASMSGGWTVVHNYQDVIKCLQELGVGSFRPFGKISLTDVVSHYKYWFITGLAFILLLLAFSGYVFFFNRKLPKLTDSLASKERLISATFYSIGDAVISTDKDGKVLAMNRVAEYLTGWNIADAEGRDVHDIFKIIHSKTRKPSTSPVAQALKDGIIATISDDTKLISRDGVERYISDSASPIRDEQNEIIGAVLVFRDTTEIYNTNMKLMLREQRFQQITNQSREIVWEIDAQGLYTYVSDGCKDVYGYRPSELIGKMYFYDIHPKERREEYKQEAFTAFSQKVPFRNYIKSIETKDGSLLYLSTNGMPMLDDGGNLLGYRGVDQDVTEKILGQKELERQNVLLSALLDSIPDLIFFKDKNGVYLGCNPEFCRFTGRNREEIIGKTDYDLFPRKVADGFREHDVQMMRINKAHHNEEQVKYPDGTLVTLDTTKAPLYNSQGEVLGLVGISRDITARKDAEKQISKANQELVAANMKAEALAAQAEFANRAKGDFLANMSHEIRTPMNAIIGFADILCDEHLTDGQKQYVQIIRNEGKALLGLINDILDFSKIESGKLEVDIIECNLGEVLSAIEITMKQLAENKGLKFEIVKDENLPAMIKTDPIRLRQCLVNLINNAIKFTEKGYVRVRASFKPSKVISYVVFYVEDTGIGIPVDKQQKIFDVFTQADASTARKYGGTGLGLAITKNLSLLLGGSLTLASTVGKGSTFMLTISAGDDLELIKKTHIQAESRHAPKPDSEKISGNVLVAEDSKTNQILVRLMLEKMGLTVTIVADGIEAVKAAEAKEYDLIFMDIQMPDMNGYDATAAIRAKGIKTPIIALTANAMKDDYDKCINAGCDDYISKPIERQRLTMLIDKYL